MNLKHTISTYTGRNIDFSNPLPSMIDCLDIARGLSCMCRFNGHITKSYSVAEHSMLVAMHLPDELQAYGLLHDAAEAYIADIVRPAKLLLDGYLELEECLLEAIAARYGLDVERFSDPLIKEADNRALVTERNVLQPNWRLNEEAWAPIDALYKPYPVIIVGTEPRVAERNFLYAFEKLIDFEYPCPVDPASDWPPEEV